MASLLALISLAALVPNAFAQSSEAPAPPPAPPSTPLASKRFEWTALPYKADTDNGERGPQLGYNLCNSTTENQNSLCQTAVINSIEDFCLWGPADPDKIVGNIEGEMIAWCTKKGYGTRLIPKGALTAVQFMKTADYVQVVGRITQQLINIKADDSGGEMDPHGADQRGNPLGGLVFSNAYTGNFVQAVEWHNFMGGGTFCLKACDPARPNAARYCEHIYDRIGCQYNAPAAYTDGAFLSCLGESQDFPGIYTGADGVVSTYSQPPESLGAISTVPYTVKIPSSSECKTYTSSALYADAPNGTGSASSSRTATSGASTKKTATGTGTQSAASTSSTSNTGAAARGVSTGALGSLAALLFAAFAL